MMHNTNTATQEPALELTQACGRGDEAAVTMLLDDGAVKKYVEPSGAGVVKRAGLEALLVLGAADYHMMTKAQRDSIYKTCT